MRVTGLMLGQDLLTNLENIQTKMETTQNQLATGTKISKPSDDPVGVEMVLGLNSSISKVKQWQDNASLGLSILQTTDTSMGNMMDLLGRVRTLAIQAANGSSTGTDRRVMSSEVSQILQQVGLLANTQVGGKYVFAGTSTSAPWSGSNPTAWTGNNGVQNVEVGQGAYVPTNVDATALFGGSGGALAVVNQFNADLQSNNVSGIQNDLNAIDTLSQNFMAKRAQIGAQTDRIQTVQQQLAQTLVNLKQSLSNVQDTNMAQAITQLTTEQNVYQAALAVGAHYIQPSLADFLN